MSWMWIPIVCAAGLLIGGYWEVAAAFVLVAAAGLGALWLTDRMAARQKRRPVR